MGYGSLLFGHANPEIIKVINQFIENGWFFSNPPLIEMEVADLIHHIIPSAELVRYATTGSDAVAYGIRAARAFTDRKKILSVIGGYHGVHEGVIPSNGVHDIVHENNDFIPFNNIDAVGEKLKTRQYAAFLLEPILANSGCTPPKDGYLNAVRNLCDLTDTVLIFDEIVTGFRTHLGGAQTEFGVIPDISLFSKAIANGFPLSVICGKKDIMEQFTPKGNVFFAGTFNGHPLSLSIAKYVIQALINNPIHETINKLGARLRAFIDQKIREYGLFASVQGYGSMFTIAFGCREFPCGLRLETSVNTNMYTKFVEILCSKGIIFPPLYTETVFLSPVHNEVIEHIEEVLAESLAELANIKVI